MPYATPSEGDAEADSEPEGDADSLLDGEGSGELEGDAAGESEAEDDMPLPGINYPREKQNALRSHGGECKSRRLSSAWPISWPPNAMPCKHGSAL